MEFQPFPKVPRLSREMIITEKLDGTNASITIAPWGDVPGEGSFDKHPATIAMVEGKGGNEYTPPPYVLCIAAGSRKRWITPGKGTDNCGFAQWVKDNAQELVKLGPGTHYGEWWGQGIQRKYGMDEKRFSLFNVSRWIDPRTQPGDPIYGDDYAPSCCHVVPVLYRGPFDTEIIVDTSLSYNEGILYDLQEGGSIAAPGFMNPEGIMIYHTAARQYFKKTFEGDEKGKGV